MELIFKKKINPVLSIIAFITLAVFIISFTVFYTEENFSATCGCKLPIWVIIISISSFGIFIGSLLFYLLNTENLKERKNISKSLKKILNFLEEDQRKIFEFILSNSGEVYQSKISKELNLNKVRCSRILNSLEKKGLIKREKNGMTNLIKLNKEINSIFQE